MCGVDPRVSLDPVFRSLTLTAKLLFLWFAREGSLRRRCGRTVPPDVDLIAYGRAMQELDGVLGKLMRYVPGSGAAGRDAEPADEVPARANAEPRRARIIHLSTARRRRPRAA
jgi:hypothetical protein